MKKPIRTFLSFCLTFIALSFITKDTIAQQSLTKINGWNAYVHLPSNYSSTTKTYPTIVFFPGLGEVGTVASKVISSGPGAYITQGWNGNVVVDGSTVEFIVISIQPPSAYPNEVAINASLQAIKNSYRVDNNRLYLTGLSHGGWMSSTFVSGDAYGGPYNYANQIAAVVTVQGMRPDDNSPYPNLFDNYANAGGKYLGFEQRLDGRDTKTVVDRMNNTKANSAIYVQTNFGGGGHCCWNEFYGGQGKQPGNFMLGGVNQNIYQWLARQSKGGATAPPSNIAPTANAGADKVLTLPANNTTLTGSGTDPDGSIVSYAWTKISGPITGSLLNNTSATATVNSLISGVYEYELKVTDNKGATATDRVKVTVNAAASNIAPVANAGADKNITLPANSVSLAGSGTDEDGSIASYAWTKTSGPSQGSISNATSATATASSLVQGTYVFTLTVKDNKGAQASDAVQVVVNATSNPPTSGGGKKINVSLFGGSNAFNNNEWNNWNASNLTSGNFLYSDRSSSSVSAVLASQDRLVDNGSSYGSTATAVPGNVLRYNSAHTSNRTLTIRGLAPNTAYDFEFFASRATTGNKTVFKIGSASQTITTDNNLNNVARFTNTRSDNTGKVTVTLSRIGTWNYLAGFTVAEAGSSSSSSSPASQVTANAGSDKTVQLPTSSVSLAGSGSTTSGSISSYTWSKVSGPAAGTISNSSSANTNVSGLAEGSYQFQLTVTDNNGSSSTDVVQVIVNEETSSPAVGRAINVNVFNGATPINNNEWNNWNPSSMSGNLLYNDRSSSNVRAQITASAMIADNGAGYASGASQFPAEVLRYNSANTSDRTLTISGLDKNKQYDIEFFASRNSTGNKTVFTIGNQSQTLNTDKNVNNLAAFNSISTDNSGKITVTLSRQGTWNYLAGFTIRESGDAFRTGDVSTATVQTSSSNAISVYPAEFVSKVSVEINNTTEGDYNISVKNATGKVVWNKSGRKSASFFKTEINTSQFINGDYTIEVVHPSGTETYHVKKIMPQGVPF